MKKRMVLYVSPTEYGWKIERLGEKRNTLLNTCVRKLGETKADAVAYARKFAINHQPSQVVVHKRDGKIQTEWTFGKDPRRSEG